MEPKISPEIVAEIKKRGFTNIEDKTPEELQIFFTALTASHLREIRKHTGLLYVIGIINLVGMGLLLILSLAGVV